MTNAWKYFLTLLALVAVTVWIAFFSYPKANLEIIACDVGQGDAILILNGERQILVDGGKGKAVLDCLSRHIPFWDRKIEVVIITHPQFDHYGGLIEVFKRYSVDRVLANSLDSESAAYEELKKVVAESGARVLNPDENVRIRVGGIYLDVVWPYREFLSANYSSNLTVEPFNKSFNVLGAYTSKRDPNDFSIVVNLSFGEFDALLTGDIGPSVIDDILAEGEIHEVEYLKVPHHGSKNGLTQSLVDATSPEIAVISVGKNTWGHPHQEVIKILKDEDIKTLRTDELGDVQVITDGGRFWLNY